MSGGVNREMDNGGDYVGLGKRFPEVPRFAVDIEAQTVYRCEARRGASTPLTTWIANAFSWSTVQAVDRDRFLRFLPVMGDLIGHPHAERSLLSHTISFHGF